MAQKRTVEELELLLKKEKRARQELEGQMRPTTLEEYLAACHTSVSSRMVIETDKRLWSKGTIPTPRDKYCPQLLRRWSDFVSLRRRTFDTLLAKFPTERRLFENRIFMTALGERV